MPTTSRRPAPGRRRPARGGRSPSARRRRSWAWRWRRLLFLFGLALLFTAGGLLYLLAGAELPPERPLDETTVLTDLHGARLASLDRGEDRVRVTLDQVPAVVKQAVIATEDRNFYDHGGLDPIGIARATVADLRGRRLQGGSTITQQYVKNAFVGRERTIVRKLKEAAVAIQVERRYDKNEILERYLNTVYFGRGAYGVQAAARAWFGKDVGDLGLPEAAYLAGLVRAPETADAGRNATEATRRRDVTLAAMQREGFITAEQRRAAEQTPLTGPGGYVLDRQAREPQVVATDKGTQYFVEAVRQELVRRYGPGAAYAGGLRVRTSLDLRLQAAAYDAVYGTLDRADDPAGALVAIDDQGNVRAMVGGRDYNADVPYAKVNFATGKAGGGSGRPAGSTFKAFVLAAVVREGYSVQSTFPAPAEITLPKANNGKDYTVANYDHDDHPEPLNLIDATKGSINTVYLGAQEAVGRDKVIEAAQAMGVTTDLRPYPSLTLGTIETSPMEMAAAYSTLANRGHRVAPRLILEVRKADGTVLERAPEPVRERALDPDDADVVNWTLEQVVRGGTGTGARVPGTDVAGKTGTTNDYADAWFVGYTPKLTAAVWMGYPEGTERKMTDVRGRRVTGGSFPATIFRSFMTDAMADEALGGQFRTVRSFPGKTLTPSSKLRFETTTTTSSTTTTVADQSSSTTSPASAPSTTTRPAPTTTAPARPPSTTTTTEPPPSTTTTTERRGLSPPGGG